MTNFRLFFNFLALLMALSFQISYANSKNFASKDVKSILVKGINFDITFEDKASKQIKVITNDKIDISLKSGQLEIINSDFYSKRKWGSNQKTLKIQIKGPSKKVNIHGDQINASFKKWKAKSFLSATKASVTDSQRKGDLNLFIRKGSFKSTGHTTGSVYLNGFVVQADMSNFKNVKTGFYFNSGKLKISKGSGDLSFSTDRAPVSIKRFSGNVNGGSYFAPVQANVKVKNKMNISSKQGNLRIYLSGGVGARVYAYSESGKVYAPKYMHKEYTGKSTKVVGRAKGAKSRARVHLKTDTGLIQVYN